MATSEKALLVPEVQDYYRQFEAIKADALCLLVDLTEDEFNWDPGSNRWSIAQCIDHLVVTGNSSVLNIHPAIDEARSKGLFSRGPFRYGMIEKWFVRQMEPPVNTKFKAPKAYEPGLTQDYVRTVAEFYKLQEEFLRCAEEADGLDLSRIKVINAVTCWFRLSLGQELAFDAAHERRHLRQAHLVREAPDFPRKATAL
jgi:hypothetical protein